MIGFVLKSSNQKTGRIPVAIAPKDTCPDVCPLKGNGCYANSGALNVHWQRVTEGTQGLSWGDFLAAVRALPAGQLWRYAQAGDLPGAGNTIDAVLLHELVEANRGRRGFTFTHKPLTDENIRLIAFANRNGFTINLSANGARHANRLLAYGIAPVVTLLEKAAKRWAMFTASGERIVVCPAQSHGKTCLECQACANPKRQAVIGFIAHGSGRANGGEKVSRIAEMN